MRILTNQLNHHIGKEATVFGRLYAVREMGGIAFAVVQDRAGLAQAVFDKKFDAKLGSIVSVTGMVKDEKRAPGGVELAGKELNVIQAPVEDLPFDLSKKELHVDITTLFDFRPLTLRHETVRSIFRVADTLLHSYAEAMRGMEFTEVKTPKILGAATEGGANFFTIDYFGTQAYLAQSPQFYKQMCVGAFERVFEIAPVFRAERHFTTRHMNEYISLDAEMGFIESEKDVMAALEQVIRSMCAAVAAKNAHELRQFGVEPPLLPKETIPAIKLSEVKEAIKKEYGYEVPKDTDIDPQGEVHACEFAKKKFNSDFLFVTHYPRVHRPFYTMASADDPKESCGFDLLFRGVELVTGSQRIHDYGELVKSIKSFKLNPEDFAFYLQAFKYAMPPHGGWAIGLERFVQKLLGLSSVKEASLFPRDVKRLIP